MLMLLFFVRIMNAMEIEIDIYSEMKLVSNSNDINTYIKENLLSIVKGYCKYNDLKNFDEDVFNSFIKEISDDRLMEVREQMKEIGIVRFSPEEKEIFNKMPVESQKKINDFFKELETKGITIMTEESFLEEKILDLYFKARLLISEMKSFIRGTILG